MNCYNCGVELTEHDFCTNCGADVVHYKKVISVSNFYYNDGLEKANVRDLSGAVVSLTECLKLNKFNIDGTYLVNSAELNKEVFDLCFECVGGNAAENAINQIIEKCKFGGDIVLTGVSENGALINTRRILEKAVRITGTTRSTVRDFKTAVDLIENTNLLDELERLVLSTNEVNDISAYYSVFEKEVENRELGKHIMKLNL